MSRTEFFTVHELRGVCNRLQPLWEDIEEMEAMGEEDGFDRAQKAWPEILGHELYPDGSIHVGEEHPYEHYYLMPDGGLFQEMLYTSEDGVAMCRSRVYRTPLTKQAILDLMPSMTPTRQVPITREELLLSEGEIPPLQDRIDRIVETNDRIVETNERLLVRLRDHTEFLETLMRPMRLLKDEARPGEQPGDTLSRLLEELGQLRGG